MNKRRHPASGFLNILAYAGVGLAFATVLFSLACGSAIGRPSPPLATAARTTTLNETGHLHLIRKHDFTLYERGSASGTVAGTINVRLTAVSSSRVTVDVSISPPGGSISGSGSGSYRRSGTVANFSGSMSFGAGTGKYKNARGSGLSFSGSIQESRSDAITVYVHGKVSD
ncbi:MAG TPA: autotransporter [Solirubrobacteraceae bacterium]|nr:autotransporter [Solirubrobacteraceae bacterium]